MGLSPLGLYSNRSPQTHIEWSDMNLSLEIKARKRPDEGGLVKISASWFWEETDYNYRAL